MINIAGQLHAATAEGVLAAANEIKDENLGKMQSVINAEQAQTNKKALAWAAAGMVL